MVWKHFGGWGRNDRDYVGRNDHHDQHGWDDYRCGGNQSRGHEKDHDDVFDHGHDQHGNGHGYGHDKHGGHGCNPPPDCGDHSPLVITGPTEVDQLIFSTESVADYDANHKGATFSLGGKDADYFIIDPETGELAAAAEFTNADGLDPHHGVYHVDVIAEDPQHHTAQLAVEIDLITAG